MPAPPDRPAGDPTGSFQGTPPSEEATPRVQGSSKPARASGPAPRRIGRFEVRGVLGHGGFGSVFRAYDPKLDREVALKVPRFPKERRDLEERFLREAQLAARLRHPGIVAVYEVGQAGAVYYIATEFVTGATLEQCLKQRPSMRQAVTWVRDLAMALEYAHSQGVIHRDIKPSNIMIDTQNRAQLMDFGLAKRLDANSLVPLAEGTPDETDLEQESQTPFLTAEGKILGTPAYMSPEQARGELDETGPHSDQYSLGAVLYELLTGHRPFEGAVMELLRQAADRSCEPRSPRELNPEITPPPGCRMHEGAEQAVGPALLGCGIPGCGPAALAQRPARPGVSPETPSKEER